MTELALKRAHFIDSLKNPDFELTNLTLITCRIRELKKEPLGFGFESSARQAIKENRDVDIEQVKKYIYLFNKDI